MTPTLPSGLRDRIATAAVLLVTIVGPASIGLHASGRRDGTRTAPTRSSPSFLPDHAVHDFGDVPIDGEPVAATFALTNDGARPIRVISLTTSCPCVTATPGLADGRAEGPGTAPYPVTCRSGCASTERPAAR
jgi:hypothetical protein